MVLVVSSRDGLEAARSSVRALLGGRKYTVNSPATGSIHSRRNDCAGACRMPVGWSPMRSGKRTKCSSP